MTDSDPIIEGPEPGVPVVFYPGLFDRGDWPRPAFVLTLSLMAGLVVGRCVPAPVWCGPAGIAMSLGLYSVFCMRHARRIERLPPPSATLLFVAVAFLGVWFSGSHAEREAHADAVARWAASRWVVTVQGQLSGTPRAVPSGTRLTLATGSVISVSGKNVTAPVPVQIEVKGRGKGDVAGWRRRWRTATAGDPVRAVGTFRDPGSGFTNPGGAGWSGRFAGTNQLGPLLVHSASDIHIRPPSAGRLPWNWFLGETARWRDAASETLMRAGGAEAGPLLVAVVLGDASQISAADYHAFGRAGLLHLFSVSGLHAGVIALALFGVLSMVGLPRRFQMSLVVAGVLVYAALTGFRIPVVRTTIMVGALAMQAWLRRPTDPLSRLSVAAFVILLLWPQSLFQAGFQLSFLAVFTLIVFAPWIAETVRFSHVAETGWKAWAARRGQLLIRTVVALTALQVALAPILAQDFHQVSLIAPLANVVVIPVVTAALLAGAILAGPGVLFPGVGSLVGPVAALLAKVSLHLSSVAAMVPFAAVPVRSFPPLGLVLYYGLFFGGAYLVFGRGPGDVSRRKAAAWIHGAALVAVIVWLPFFAPGAPEHLRVTFLDVGQGDCTLIELPGGGAMLIDAGPLQPGGVARYTLEPVLNYYGIHAIDFALATHPDSDHIGGFEDLFEDVPVYRFAGAPGEGGGSTWQSVEASARRHRAVRLAPVAGMRIRTPVPDLDIDVLNPAKDDLVRGADRNTDSIVLRITWKKFSLLLTGDADKEAEDRMIRRWGREGLRSTVLKAGHHGSDSSSSEEFLDAVHPAFVVFSCGRNNRYGHPTRAVVARCRAVGAETHRTDLNGALVLETDGERLWETFRDPRNL